MKKAILSLLAWSMPFILLAQNNSSNHSVLTKEGPGATEGKGIQWATGLSWEQVKEKAKSENKYIFLDCFATWCGPCKKMDKKVYINDTVGDLFNTKFIAVKVQMDRTDKDNEGVKKWYADADRIKEKYHVGSYPSFIFLSPAGEIVDMAVGYQPVPEFISIAKTALMPGKVYNDPYAEYQRLVIQYNNGVIDYEKIPYMVRCAIRLKQGDFAVQFIKEHLKYAKTLSKEERYTKENIEMWSLISLGTKTSIFKYFYEDGKMIDKIMRQPGYSEKVIDRSIISQFVNPFFNHQNKDTTIPMTGMYVNDPNNTQTSYVGVNWDMLNDSITKEVNSYYAAKNVLYAKMEWYHRHRNWSLSCKYSLEYWSKYYSENGNTYLLLNSAAWSTFEHCTDKKTIDGFILLLKKALAVHNDYAAMMDTYANLLYKAGRVKEAINWEMKAAAATEKRKSYESENDDYMKVLEKMKKGEPIEDVVWGYK